MKPFHLVAVPHEDIIQGRLTMDVFAADLWEVFQGRAVEDYQNPEVFFRKTYLTAGIKTLLKVTSKRLMGEGGDPVVQIQTPFGGGKTHSLIALYHAFTNPEAVRRYFEEAVEAKVVVIVGTAISPRQEEGEITGTIWSEIEKQLEGEVKKLKSPVSPGRERLREVLERHQPLLILIDELLEYIAKAAGIKAGYRELKVGDTNLAAQTIAFMQELTETVKSLDKTLLVVTLPSSVMEYPDEEAAEKMLAKLQKVAGRVEKIYTPVAGEEIYEVIRRRLFRSIDKGAAKEIVNEYIDYYEKEGIVVDKAEYRSKMFRSYPFHPEVIDVLHHRWGSIPTFQRTRGVLRILSLAVYRLKDSQIPLIHLSDFDLSYGELAEELIKHVGREYESVLSGDITARDSNAKKVDRTLGGTYQGLKLGTKLATAIFLYSFSGGERGISLGELKLACADPNIPSSVVTEVVDKLTSTLYYLWREDGRYLFKSQANLNRAIISKMSEIESEQLNQEIKSLIERHAGKALPAYIWPRSTKDIPDSEDLKLVILQTQDLDFAKEILQNYGENPRVNKNTLFFSTPMENERISFETWLRKKLAWESVAKDKSLNLTQAQKREVEKNVKEFKKDERNQLRRFYRLVYVPAKEFREIDLGIPIFGDDRNITNEILERLKAEGEIIEKMSPYLILEKYLGGKDYIEIKQLYKTLLTTPGEPRIGKENFIKSIRNGVAEGIFGFGVIKDGTVECLKFKEMPDVSLQDYEAIIKKELCEKREYEFKETEAMERVFHESTPEVYDTPTSKISAEGAVQVSPAFQESVINSIILEVKLPKGKFSEFYKYVLKSIENSFEKSDVIIKIAARHGSLKKSDYENKVKETLYQINAEIMDEKLE
ncbi:MAG: ATP-binding protein [Caldiserica bacterium]|nr:ATP-binding protein [Caldisericota bacterium]